MFEAGDKRPKSCCGRGKFELGKEDVCFLYKQKRGVSSREGGTLYYGRKKNQRGGIAEREKCRWEWGSVRVRSIDLEKASPAGVQAENQTNRDPSDRDRDTYTDTRQQLAVDWIRRPGTADEAWLGVSMGGSSAAQQIGGRRLEGGVGALQGEGFVGVAFLGFATLSRQRLSRKCLFIR